METTLLVAGSMELLDVTPLTEVEQMSKISFLISLASFPGRIGETAWQLSRVQTVYGCYVMVIAIFHYNILVHVILTIFPAVRMGLSCTWKQLFAARSTTEVK